jgi:hypothetical protein
MRSLLALIPLTAIVAYADDATRVVDVEKIKLTVPESWKSEKPSNNLRLAQFSIAPADGDQDSAELTISPPIGGTTEANITRWIGQFDAEGREAKLTQGSVEQGDYILVDLKGTYKKPMGPPVLGKTTPVPGYKMLGVVFKAKGGGNYFFKLTGPEKTVAAQSEALRTAFGAKAADEKEYKLPE